MARMRARLQEVCKRRPRKRPLTQRQLNARAGLRQPAPVAPPRRKRSNPSAAVDGEYLRQQQRRAAPAPVMLPQLSEEQRAAQQAATDAAGAQAASQARVAAWTATQALAAEAQRAANAAIETASRLEAEAKIEQQKIEAACVEYNALRRTIKLCTDAFKARHGREPKSLREVSDRHRDAWKRRVELRKEYPGRPWGDAVEVPPMSSAQAMPPLPRLRAPPSAASNLSMTF